MKKVLLFAAAALAMASCTNSDYLGEGTPQEGQGSAIQFAGKSSNITRATGEDAAILLNNKFHVFGVKKVSGEKYVFAHVATGNTVNDAETYDVWYEKDDAGTTTTNKNGWEYVGTSGTKAQTIKYWDYAATNYTFIAYSNGKNTTAATVTDITTTGYTVAGTLAQFQQFYMAEKKIVAKDEYNSTVQFKFRAAAAKVRLGIYETIPGYDITDIKFYLGDTEQTSSVLSGKFPNSTTSRTMEVTYDASNMPVMALSSGGSEDTSFDFGTMTLATGTTMKTTSADPTWAEGVATDNHYIPVFPYASTTAMVLKVNYTLTNSITGETITVHGATAAVPKEYMQWAANHAYTYLFKITDNTNGTTEESGSAVGLYPITFDAVVEDVIATEDGTITTVAQGAYVTTYAEGSASASGITYTAAGKNIYATVTDISGNLLDILSAEVYASSKTDLTEADLIASETTYKTGRDLGATIPTTDTKLSAGTIVLPASKHAKLPVLTGAGTYYVKLKHSTDKYSYKVIVVQ